ncbi:MAG: S41 family peptidase [Bacteroidia bacterium]
MIIKIVALSFLSSIQIFLKRTLQLLFLFLYVVTALAQTEKINPLYNSGFEKVTAGNKLPDGWFRWGTDDYIVRIDTSIKHSGKNSILIESTKNSAKSSFGSIAYSLPANYLGKEIEVRAYVRVQDILDNELSILLRVDDKNKNVLAMENGRQKNIQGSGYWNYYTVSVPFPAKAQTIYIGAMLTGKGKLWVDDFQVLIDGKDISKAKRKAKIELPADRDKEFDEGSLITAEMINKTDKENLFLLGKLWGFLKYYHPAIAKGNYNWDYELFRILPKVMACKDVKERNILFYSWINQLGDIKIDEKQFSPDTVGVKVVASFDWLNDSLTLGTPLTTLLNQIKNSKRSAVHYYLEINQTRGTAEFTNERTYNDLLYPDAGFQLLSLYRYWNTIEYNYPYKYLLVDDWNNVLKQYIPRFVNASTELDYKLAVLSIIGCIHDANANILAPNPVVTQFKGVNKVPLDVSWIENKAVITGVMNHALVAKTELKNGDVLLKINDKLVDSIIKQRLDYTPASRPIIQLRNVCTDLLRTNDSVLTVTYLRNDSMGTTVVKSYSRDWLIKLKNQQKKDTCFKFITPDIMYINAASIKNTYLEKVMPSLLKTKGVIVDLRNVPNETIVHTLGDYLIGNVTPFAKYTKPLMKSPGQFKFYENKTIGTTARKVYKGKLVVLINEYTQGAAEYHAMAFKAIPKTTLVGSASAGANGALSDIYLPGGIRTMISGLGICYPNGAETQIVGIAPHVQVLPTVKAIAEGKDELVDKAVELINR